MADRTIELRPGESLTFSDGTRVFVRGADGDADHPAATDPNKPPLIFGAVKNMRVVGEKGPELETTAPAKLYSKDELAAEIGKARQDLAAASAGGSAGCPRCGNTNLLRFTFLESDHETAICEACAKQEAGPPNATPMEVLLMTAWASRTAHLCETPSQFGARMARELGEVCHAFAAEEKRLLAANAAGVGVYDPVTGTAASPPDVERNWHGEPIPSGPTSSAVAHSD